MTPTKHTDTASTSPRKRVPPLARHALLVRWLSPKVEGDAEAGRFVGRPAREIADAFNRQFETRVSARTVLRYVHEALEWARRRAERAQREAGAGAGAAESSGGVEAVPSSPRPRGRPKSASPQKPRARKVLPAVKLPSLTVRRRRAKDPEGVAPTPAPSVIPAVGPAVEPAAAIDTEETPVLPVAHPSGKREATSRAKPGPKPRAKRWSRVWWELQMLTGYSARTLHDRLAKVSTIAPLIGSRASFVAGLAELGAPRPVWDPVSAVHAVSGAADDAFTADLRECGVMHVLHLHPVVLNTTRGEWAVLLLAFDPLSQFINAMLLDFDGSREGGSPPRPRGRPRKPCDEGWSVTIEGEGVATQIHVPTAAYWALVTDTVGKTGISYRPIWLSPSAAGGDAFLDALRRCSPSDTFARAPVAPWPRGPVTVPLSIQNVCKRLGEAINAHNRMNAQPKLREVRARIAALIDRGRVPPGTLARLEADGLFEPRRDPIIILGLPHPPRPDVRRFALLSAFQAGYPRLSARGHLVAIRPRRVQSRCVSGDAAAQVNKPRQAKPVGAIEDVAPGAGHRDRPPAWVKRTD